MIRNRSIREAEIYKIMRNKFGSRYTEITVERTHSPIRNSARTSSPVSNYGSSRCPVLSSFIINKTHVEPQTRYRLVQAQFLQNVKAAEDLIHPRGFRATLVFRCFIGEIKILRSILIVLL